MNKKTAEIIAEKTERITKKLIYKRQKAYLRPFFSAKKPWADTAVEYAAAFALTVDRRVKAYRNKCIKLISGRDLYVADTGLQKADKKTGNEYKKKYKTNEYLDSRYDRVVVPDIKDVLVEMEKDLEKELANDYEKYITSGSLRDSAELVYKDLGMTFNFNKFNESTSGYIKEKKINWSKEVAETTEKAVKLELVRGYEKGLSTYDIAENIRRATGFSYSRSESIARTEILSSCNYANYAASCASPNVIGFEWAATGDDRTRLTHMEADGQKRKKGEPFDVGGYQLRFPLDGSLGAPAGEIINCRCVLLDVFEGEGLESNTVYDEQDAGTNEWLLRQTKEFQESYLGGKAKCALFQSGSFDIKDREKPTKEVLAALLKKSRDNLMKIPAINPLDADKKEYYDNVLDAVWEVQHRGLHGNKEYGRVVDYSTGSVASGKELKNIIAGSINEYSIKFTPEQIRELNKEKDAYIVIHNHPDSITFSFGDLVFLHENRGVKSLIVVGHDGSVFYLSGNGRIKGLPDEDGEIKEYIKKESAAILNEAVKYYEKFYNEKPNGIDNKFRVIYNEIIRRKAESFGFIYR